MTLSRTRVLACLIALVAFSLGLYVLRDERVPLATLTTRHGAIDRDHAAHVGTFAAAEDGAQFFEGDGLRTGQSARAELETASGSLVIVGENSTVRFTSAVDGSEHAIGLDIAMGVATIRARDKAARIHTHVGLAVLDERSEVELRRRDGGLELEVKLGSLRFNDQTGTEHVLGEADPLAVGIGMAVLEKSITPREDGVQIEVSGDGNVERRAGGGVSALPQGVHSLPRGTLLKLSGGSHVKVAQGDGSVTLDAPGSYRLDGRNHAVEALSGIMRLTAWSRDVSVAVPGGVIVARATPGGSEAEVWLTPEGGDLRVLRGSAQLEHGGEKTELVEGAVQSWPRKRSEADNSGTTTLDSLPFAHLDVRAGESFVVHAPGAPLSIGFRLAKACSGPVELELANGKRRVLGAGTINAAFAAGVTNYQVRCGRALKARGRVTLLLDAGTRKLPTRAQTTDVDADGRAYSIYYQNQLPEIRVRWPQAPQSGPFTVEADGARHETSTPTFVFSSGMLGDGPHTITWSAGKRRSRPALVDILYDSAAPTASLSEPEDRGFAVGDSVRVRGEALRAWKVELANGTIERDAHDRFAGERVTTEASPDITVRLSHPRHGVHYYVRRSLESP